MMALLLKPWSSASQAGPRPMHISLRPPHVLCSLSHGSPAPQRAEFRCPCYNKQHPRHLPAVLWRALRGRCDAVKGALVHPLTLGMRDISRGHAQKPSEQPYGHAICECCWRTRVLAEGAEHIGEVSPTLLCPKAATKSPRMLAFPPLRAASPAAHSSRNWLATPLLSPLMRSLVLLMEVPCTGNHVSAPRPAAV